MTKADEQTLRQNSGQATPEGMCPTCGSPLAEITITKTGRKLQRCSKGSWNPETRKNEGCDYVKWFEVEPQELDEKCPKCGSKLILAVTRFGKKMKKCSSGSWDKEAKKAIGCDFVEWINGTTEPLDEECPQCGQKLVLYTTANGKKMKKCSTSGWDKVARKATGCPYVYWLKPEEYLFEPESQSRRPQQADKTDNGGEEFLPPEPKE